MSDEVPVPPSPDVVAALGGSQVPPAPDVSNLPATSRPAPNTPLPQQQTQQGPPKLGQPNIVSLISGLIKPPQQVDTSSGFAVSRPASRTEVFERFLGNFLYSMGAGLHASGHGPGAFGRGLGAAITAGPQRDLQQYELGQQQQAQQAGIAREQAQTELTQRQAQMAGQMATVNMPGFGPVSMPVSALANFYKGGFSAGMNAQSKLTVEELKDKAAQGQVARVMPGIDPQTNQPAMLAYNKTNQLVGVVPGAFNPATLPKVSTQQQWLQTSPGVWELVNKTSTSQTVIPPGLAQKVPALAGAGQPTPPSGFPKPTGATSTPVARPAGATTPQGGRKIYGS